MQISEEEFATLVSLAKKVLWTDIETRRRLEAHKLHISPANFYASIPSIEDYERSFEFREPARSQGAYLSPTVFNLQRTRDFVNKIKGYAAEFDPQLEEDESNPEKHFYWRNTSFSYVDAMSYYCVLRHVKPKRLIEVGAGNSTLIANQALKKNGFGEIVIIEPYPLPYLAELETVSEIIESFIQDIDLLELRDLIESAEVFFIDSTHTVKVGSDCLYIYLKLLPIIRTNLVVHAHDIALPYAFAIKHLDKHIYWTEQYLLYAYLLDNPKTAVLMGSLYTQQHLPELSKELMGGKFPDGGGSIWFEYRGDGTRAVDGFSLPNFFRRFFKSQDKI